eukprot:PLAT3915.2.p1 GENE.PLAT3915.2~~PLAT3915.2.p1  ORF type:complete len:615 (+),score=308.80 PLAT3915.2:91-1935(+)
MEVAYLYSTRRSEFGKHCYFEDTAPRVLESIPVTDLYDDDYIMKNPCTVTLDTTKDMSEHEVNTERVLRTSRGIRHREGGWPKDLDPTEPSDTGRFIKRTEKEEPYKATVKAIGPVVDRAIKQNNTIDIYEEYFSGEVIDHSGEPPSAKGLAVFRDPNPVKRTATSICWHPEGPAKVAVAYSILNFQDPRFMSERLPVSSYIWDVTNPNTPDQELTPSSPLCCLRFNPKTTETLVGGSYNGLISFFDLRKSGSLPCESSVIENSHHDPVYDVYWISSKTGNLCASVSTDGQMMWWDTRRLGEPTEVLQLDNGSGTVLGGSSMEYNTEAGPTKYLVGTEQGVVLSVNSRNKKMNNGIQVFDQATGKHHGPITAIMRNPIHPKFFLTVGDWTARIWVEDLKTPIMTTKYHPSYLTNGCWSPTRPGVFMVTRMDGVVDIWDYLYRQNEEAHRYKVGDAALASIAVQGSSSSGGRLVAVGDVRGTVSLLELCSSLATPQASEKAAIAGMFDREQKRERMLELQSKARRSGDSSHDDDGDGGEESKDDGDEATAALLRRVDEEFLAMIKTAGDDEETDVELMGEAGEGAPAGSGSAAAGGEAVRGESFHGEEGKEEDDE